MRHEVVALGAMLFALGTNAVGQDPHAAFIVTNTSRSPGEVVAAIKSYSEQRKWQYLGENKVNKGRVTLVKICIPEVGQVMWPVGLQLSALLPCGNLGIYQNGATTEISVLHPRYMHVLYPDPATERASAIAEPLLREMLKVIAQQ